jgi:hypothetical protein
MGHHQSDRIGGDGMDGHGARGVGRTGEPPRADGRRKERAPGTAQARQAWERLVASCRREAKRAVG